MKGFEILKSNVEDICWLLKNEDIDWCHVTEGRERLGKTTASCWIFKMSEKFLGVDTEKNPSIERVGFNREWWEEEVTKTTETPIMPDEGAFLFYARDAMTKDVKESSKDLTTIGFCHHLIIINLPEFRIIDPYIRRHRIDSLIKVVGRGWAHFYSKKKIDEIHEDPRNDRKLVYPKPDFRFSFPKYTGPFLKQIDEKKQEWRKSKRTAKQEEKQAEKKVEKTVFEVAEEILQDKKAVDMLTRKWGTRTIVSRELLAQVYGLNEDRAISVKRIIEKNITR